MRSRFGVDVVERRDPRRDQARRAEAPLDLRGVLRHSPLANDRVQLILVGLACGGVREARIGGQIRPSDQIRDRPPVRVALRRDRGELAVPRRVDVVRSVPPVAVAQRPGRPSRRLELHHRVAADGRRGLDHRKVEPLRPAHPIAPVQRRDQRTRQRVARNRIGVEPARVHPVVALISVDRGEARHRLGRRAVGRIGRIGAGDPVAGERGEDHARVDAAQRLQRDAPLVEHAGAEVFGHDVEFRREPPEQIAPGLRVEVERDAALVQVHRVEQPLRVERVLRAPLVGDPVRHPRPDGAPDIRALQRLDLHDLRAEQRQQLRRQRARPGLCERQHPHVVERSRGARAARFRGRLARLAAQFVLKLGVVFTQARRRTAQRPDRRLNPPRTARHARLTTVELRAHEELALAQLLVFDQLVD